MTVLAPERDETSDLSQEKEAKLLAEIAEAEQGETTSAVDVLTQEESRMKKAAA